MEGPLLDRIYLWVLEANYGYKPTAERDRLLEEADSLLQKLKNRLSAAERCELDKFCTSLDGAAAEDNEVFFKIGFKFGMSLAAECLS